MKSCRSRTANLSSDLRSTAESGFTLLEMSIVLIIAGTLLVAAVTIAIPLIKEARIVGTQGKLDKIAKAIDFYATRNNRVPCPANPLQAAANPPFGYERGSGANGDSVPANCGAQANTIGIIPFKTLGIPLDWVKDAWGNYMTYAISPAFSIDTTQDIPVHARCRTADWYSSAITYEPGHANTPQNIHVAPTKARFCCPYPAAYPPASDLTVLDANGNSQLVIDRSSGVASTASTSVTFPNPIAASQYPATNDRPTAAVYLLLSHGENGYGAYNIATGVRNAVAGATPHEQTNAGDTGTFYEVPKLDRAGAEKFFDDVVVWRTQDLILASQGKTCAGP